MSERLEVTDPAAYRGKLSVLLAGRDPLEVLAETPQKLRDLFADRIAEFVRRRPFEGKWTPLEVAGHLVDAEWAYGWRLRSVFGDTRPPIQAMNQDLWVERQGHNDREPDDLLDEFTELRQRNMPLWRRLTSEDLERVGLHNERGEESLETMRLMTAGHDLSHLDQIARYLDALDSQS